jgi:hypothetical protein
LSPPTQTITDEYQISHHLLALYGTGAGASSLQLGYDNNTDYQRPALPLHEQVIEELKSWDHAKKYLGKEKYYPDFLRFFQKEIEAKGYEEVLNEYIFKGDVTADELFSRLFAGMSLNSAHCSMWKSDC